MEIGLGVICNTDTETLKALEVFKQYGYTYAQASGSKGSLTYYGQYHCVHILQGEYLAGNYKPRDTSNGITYLPYQEFMAKYDKLTTRKLLSCLKTLKV